MYRYKLIQRKEDQKNFLQKQPNETQSVATAPKGIDSDEDDVLPEVSKRPRLELQVKLPKNQVKTSIFTLLKSNYNKLVGILIDSNLVDEENLDLKFFENRIISLDVKINQTPLTLINIYAPNLRDEQVKFIEELHYFLYDKKNLILGGDFNNSFEVNSDKGIEKKWDDLNKLFKLKEAIRPLDNEDFLYTWTNGHHFSRIDRIYLRKKENFLNLNYSECISNSISDHKIVISELSILEPFKARKFKKNSDWKLNEQILECKKVNNYIIRRCSEIPFMI
ncbi:unnamed protein product, partial [Brachionus calyciflorus]